MQCGRNGKLHREITKYHPCESCWNLPTTFFETLSKYIYTENAYANALSMCSAAVCAPAAPLAATVGRPCGLESQQESVCPSSLGQTSTNQQKQMGVYLGGLGTVENMEEIRHQELFLLLAYLLKTPLTEAHHFRECFFVSFSISHFSHSCLLSVFGFIEHLPLSLSCLPPHFNDPSFARPPRSHSLSLYLNYRFDNVSVPLKH